MEFAPTTEVTLMLIGVAGAALTVIATWAARRLVAAFERRTGIEIAGKHEALLERLAAQAVAFAEEQARKRAKRRDPVLSSGAKLQTAVDWFSRQAQALRLDDIATAQIIRLLEARLGARRESDAVTASTAQPVKSTAKPRAKK